MPPKPVRNSLQSRVQRQTQRLAKLMRRVPKGPMRQLLEITAFEELMGELGPSYKESGENNLYEYFLSNKYVASTATYLHQLLVRNYSVQAGGPNGEKFSVSASGPQWYDDGVMVLQGASPFAGHIMLYKGHELRSGVAARNIQGGEELGPDDLLFIPIEQAKRAADELGIKKEKPDSVQKLREGIERLRSLLADQCNEEKEYQSLLEDHPWMFGAQHRKLDPRKKLNEEHIPDFLAERMSDECYDLIEIKPPYLPLFSAQGQPNAAFHDVWSQAERYLHFAIRNAPYLRDQKGIQFRHPVCYLVFMENHGEAVHRHLDIKMSMNPAIHAYSWRDVLKLAEGTLDLMTRLVVEEETPTQDE